MLKGQKVLLLLSFKIKIAILSLLQKLVLQNLETQVVHNMQQGSR